MNNCTFCEVVNGYNYVIMIEINNNNSNVFCCKKCWSSLGSFLTIINCEDLFDFQYVSSLIKSNKTLKKKLKIWN